MALTAQDLYDEWRGWDDPHWHTLEAPERGRWEHVRVAAQKWADKYGDEQYSVGYDEGWDAGWESSGE